MKLIIHSPFSSLKFIKKAPTLKVTSQPWMENKTIGFPKTATKTQLGNTSDFVDYGVGHIHF